jgi:NitT/TauT family transport system permease protein
MRQPIKLLPLLGPILVLGLWWAVTAFRIVIPELLPPLGKTSQRFIELFASGVIFPHLWATLYRTLIGLGAACLLGVPIGLVLGRYTRIYQAFGIVIDFFRSLPGTALFPLFLLLFGIGDGSKIALAFFISFWVILLNSAYGVLHGSKTRTKVAKSLGATNWQIFTGVTCMEALPQIFVGLRTAISLSLIMVVVSEMFIGSDMGLGQKVYDSYLTYEAVSLYAWLLIIGLLGFALNRLFLLLERHTLHWVGK